MLKWFRKYNKYLLAVLGSVLMVAFLIEPAMNMFAPSAAGQVIGKLDHQEITLGDQQQATQQLMLLQGISPLLGQTAGAVPFERVEPLHWLLMLHEARSMGLSASQFEVDQLLGAVGLGEQEMTQLQQSFYATRQQLRSVVRDWLIVQQYKEIMLGLGHLSLDQRLGNLSMASQMMQFGYLPGAIMALESSVGQPRITEPLLTRFLHDQQASVSATVLPLRADRLLDQVEDPEPALLEELFEQYRGYLPGSLESAYGFGYKYPDRVKLEYLAVPMDRLQNQVRVPENEALAYYDQHIDEFTTTPPAPENDAQDDQQADAQPQVQPYVQVRDQIVRRLQNQRAQELGQRIVRSAQAMLTEQVRRGTADSSDLTQIAEQIQRQFGVLPDVYRHDDQWLGYSQVIALPGIGRAWVADRPQVSFADYVFAAQPLRDDPFAADQADRNSPLLGMRLATYEPSQPLTGFGQSFYLFRLIDASRSHEPASLNEVREQVEQDARRLLAYQRLEQQQSRWLGRARTESLEELADEVESRLLTTRPFSRREFGPQGMLVTPDLVGVGTSESFVDGVFELVDQVLDQGGMAATTEQQRLGVVPVANQLSLYLVRIDEFEPMPRNVYEEFAASPQVAMYIHQTILNGDGETANPLGLDAVIERVGFRYTTPPSGDESASEAEPQA